MGERNLDFDRVIDRKGTKCLKYDFAKKRGLPEDVLPLWVADMDFRISSYIEDALAAQVKHGIYGYTEVDDEYFHVVRKWVKNHYGWDVKEKWFHKSPGVVFALACAVKAYTNEGDSVLIQQPVYYPFSEVVIDNHRRLVSSDLIRSEDGSYSIDFDDFEKKIVENGVKLFLLCNPHNPVGRVWDREELLKIGHICKKNGVVVFSDEIHADFVWGKKHTTFNLAGPDFAEFSVTAISPSKTFNIAGLQVANLFIPNDAIRDQFHRQYNAAGYSQLNAAGIIAAQAAYEHGQEWYEEVLRYIEANIEFAVDFVNNNLKGVTLRKPEGTYLIWLDFRGTGLSTSEIENMIIHKAGLWLDSGAIFGNTGQGFQRINTACPRATLEAALVRIKNALNEAG